METFFTVYKVTNKINGKYYVGMHKTRDLDDGYVASGLLISRAIEKYGLENFNREILHFLDSDEEMKEKEAEIVDEDFVADPMTYNLKVGGEGGWDHLNSNSEIQRKKAYKSNMKQALNRKLNPNYYEGRWTGETFRKLHREGRIKAPSFKGKKHSERAKRKIGEATAKAQRGKKNSQYGSMWITDGSINRKIKKTDSIPQGFRKGRII